MKPKSLCLIHRNNSWNLKVLHDLVVLYHLHCVGHRLQVTLSLRRVEIQNVLFDQSEWGKSDLNNKDASFPTDLPHRLQNSCLKILSMLINMCVFEFKCLVYYVSHSVCFSTYLFSEAEQCLLHTKQVYSHHKPTIFLLQPTNFLLSTRTSILHSYNFDLLSAINNTHVALPSGMCSPIEQLGCCASVSKMRLP